MPMTLIDPPQGVTHAIAVSMDDTNIAGSPAFAPQIVEVIGVAQGSESVVKCPINRFRHGSFCSPFCATSPKW